MRIPLAILGLTGLIGPVTLMREFMAVSGNNTQGPMVILAASWLWMAVGAWLAEYRGRGIVFGRETADTWSCPYAATLVLVALFLPLQIVLARATPRDWIGAWSGVGLGVLLSAPLNLMLGAQRLGLGTCHIGFFNVALERNQGLLRMLGLPPERQVEVVLTLGYPRFKFRRGLLRRRMELVWNPAE